MQTPTSLRLYVAALGCVAWAQQSTYLSEPFVRSSHFLWCKAAAVNPSLGPVAPSGESYKFLPLAAYAFGVLSYKRALFCLEILDASQAPADKALSLRLSRFTGRTTCGTLSSAACVPGRLCAGMPANTSSRTLLDSAVLCCQSYGCYRA